jgi:hypothetical protein
MRPSQQTLGGQLPQDVIKLIASVRDLPVRSILNLCQQNRRYRELICNNREFWVNLAASRVNSNPERFQGMSIEQIQRHLHLPTLEEKILNRTREIDELLEQNEINMFKDRRLYEMNKEKYYRELDKIDPLINDLSHLRRLYQALPRRGHVDITISPRDYEYFRDSYRTFRIEDYLYIQRFDKQYPAGTLIVISAPDGTPKYFYHIGTTEQSNWYERVPELPRTVINEARGKHWNLADLAVIYDLPANVLSYH